LSELRKGRRCNPHLAAWFETISEDNIFLSVLTIGELRRGIENIHRRDARSAASLNNWLRETIENFHDRILPIDQDIAQEWGRMNVPNPLPVIDGLLAATAKVRGLILVTRNIKDIARSGVSVLNPFVA